MKVHIGKKEKGGIGSGRVLERGVQVGRLRETWMVIKAHPHVTTVS